MWNKSVSLKKRAWSRKPLVPIKQTKNKHCHISTQGPVGCRAEVESGSTTPEHQMVLRECVVRRQRKTGRQGYSSSSRILSEEGGEAWLTNSTELGQNHQGTAHMRLKTQGGAQVPPSARKSSWFVFKS